MNDYKSDEFRIAKYLRSSANYVEYFNRHREALKNIGRGEWDNIEYIDELIDNPCKTIYRVTPGRIRTDKDSNLILGVDPVYEFAPASTYTIRNSAIHRYIPNTHHEYEIATLADIQHIEAISGIGYYLKSMDDVPVHECNTWPLSNKPFLFQAWITYDELFFDKEEAKDYSIAITKFLQYNSAAVTAMSRYT